jgi:CHAD domain-containing protein
MASTIETRLYAGQGATRLLGRLAFQMSATKKAPVADAVHDLRVSIRRFSQALTVFKPCFQGKETRKTRRRLKRLMTQAGTVRNCDVVLKLLAKSNASDAPALRAKLQDQRKQAERPLVAALKRRIERKSSLKWRTALESALASADDRFCHTPIEETARRVLPGQAKEFLRLGNNAAQGKLSQEKLHQFRIASKKFRYSLELFAPVYGASLKRWLEGIKHAQNLLGDINDCATAAEMVSALKGSRSILGWLKKRERRKMEEFRRWWPEAFGGREVHRNWMRSLSHPPSAAVKKPAARAEAPRARIATVGAS